MAELAPPNPNPKSPLYRADSLLPAPPTAPPPLAATPLFPRRPSLRITSEFDSDSLIFFQKVSCKVLDNLAKFKLSFQNNTKREISNPQLAFTSKYLSLFYDFQDRNALIKGSFDVGPRLQFRALHDLKAKQGELSMVAKLADPGYALEIASPTPYIGLPRATFKFPFGEVSLEESQETAEEEANRTLLVDGIVKGRVLNGIYAAHYKGDELKLRYAYKDESLSFIPSISLPSNSLSFAFKRRFSDSDKLSYWYNFDSDNWSAVYKRTHGKDFKFKAGYDAAVHLGWASLWVGDESGKAKTTPMKMKVQFMLQVPKYDIKSSALMFRVKKRWDI